MFPPSKYLRRNHKDLGKDFTLYFVSFVAATTQRLWLCYTFHGLKSQSCSANESEYGPIATRNLLEIHPGWILSHSSCNLQVTTWPHLLSLAVKHSKLWLCSFCGGPSPHVALALKGLSHNRHLLPIHMEVTHRTSSLLDHSEEFKCSNGQPCASSLH